MTSLLFDTLKLSRTLQEKGQFTPDQANALAEGISSASIDNLATKEDIKDLRSEIRGDISELRHEFKGDISALEIRLQRLIIGGFGVQLAILGAVITFLHR
jgi:hypothetical protein